MFSILEVAERLGISVGYIYKLCTLFSLKARGPRGQKRYFSQQEVDILSVLVILSNCGVEVETLRRLYTTCVKKGVWNIEQLIQEVPYLPVRAAELSSKADKTLKIVKSWYPNIK